MLIMRELRLTTNQKVGDSSSSGCTTLKALQLNKLQGFLLGVFGSSNLAAAGILPESAGWSPFIGKFNGSIRTLMGHQTLSPCHRCWHGVTRFMESRSAPTLHLRLEGRDKREARANKSRSQRWESGTYPTTSAMRSLLCPWRTLGA